MYMYKPTIIVHVEIMSQFDLWMIGLGCLFMR